MENTSILEKIREKRIFLQDGDHWGYFFCLKTFLQQILPCNASFTHHCTHTHTYTHTQDLGVPPLDIDAEPLLHTGRYTQENPFCTCLTHPRYPVGFQYLVSLRREFKVT